MNEHHLFPAIAPHRSGFLQADPLHRLYWEACGNPAGAPVVFLHGGPGSGCGPSHRRFFDPAFYHAILFDQRGAGRSTPAASIERNTTADLVTDIERLRLHLGIEKWLVFGGSWGSTLALAYAETHPSAVAGLVLRGIFLARQMEIDWFITGMGMIFPEAHQRFINYLPEAERKDPLEAYFRRLTDPDPAVHGPAARRWTAYEGACSTLLPSPETASPTGTAEDQFALGLARLEAHYMRHLAFMTEGELIAGVGRIRHLPAVIVQGRYDIVCPIATADKLATAWPEADYRIVANAGHSAMEPGIRHELLDALERMKKRARW